MAGESRSRLARLTVSSAVAHTLFSPDVTTRSDSDPAHVSSGMHVCRNGPLWCTYGTGIDSSSSRKSQRSSARFVLLCGQTQTGLWGSSNTKSNKDTRVEPIVYGIFID